MRYHFVVACCKEEASREGLSTVAFDSDAGTLTELGTYHGNPSPSFLIRAGDLLYAANEIGGKGMISSLGVGPEGAIRLLDSAQVAGMHTCHVAAGEEAVYAANYSSGNIFAVARGESGSLGPVLSDIKFQGRGPNSNRQQEPHAHSVNLTPDGRYLIAVDLGTDRLMVYAIEPDGSLRPHPTQPQVAVPPGEGPRHIAFHPTGKWLYVITELGLSVVRFTYEGEGILSKSGLTPLLAEPFTQADTAADIHCNGAGTMLYASVRGKNRIVAFRIAADGDLERVGDYGSCGDSPRNICLTRDGKYLAAAHPMSGDVVIFPIDPATGSLGEKAAGIVLDKASCIIEG